MATDKQIAANRANAQKSTGPKTPEGKATCAVNGKRHGLTAQVCLMPDEDRTAHDSFCARYIAAYAPADIVEHQLAETIAEDNWRLTRARAIETNIFALGHDGPAGDIQANHPEIHAAATAARVYMENPHQFQLLTLYIQRTNREIHRNTQLLRQLQAERKAARAAALDEAVNLYGLHQMTAAAASTETSTEPDQPAQGESSGQLIPEVPHRSSLPMVNGETVLRDTEAQHIPQQSQAPNAAIAQQIGSAFSTHEIEAALTRRIALKHASIAASVNFDPRKYEIRTTPWVA